MSVSLESLPYSHTREQQKRLKELLTEEKRRRGLTDLRFLCKHILGYSDLTEQDGFHGEYCRHLQSTKNKFKLTLTPRGTLKSSVGTIGHSIQHILRNPNIRILIGSEKYTNSTAFLSEIKGQFEKNTILRDLYGDYVGNVWNKGEIIVKQRTIWKKEPTISCSGIDVTKVGMHYDVIKADDPHSDQNTGNQEQIDKVIRWYRLLLSLLDPGGCLDITGTIWHYNDLYSYIINKEREREEKGKKKKFVIFRRDAFEGTNDDLMNEKVTKDKLLWPERLSADFLRDQLIEQGPYIFSCQYRLNPVDDDTAVFKRSWIKTCDYSKVPEGLNIYTTIDPMRDEEGKDYLALVTVGIDSYFRNYILDVTRLKADEHETVETMASVYKVFRPIKMGIESVAWQKTYVKYVQMLQLMKGYKLPITMLKTDTKVTKKMRIKGMVPYWKAGLFIIPCDKGILDNLVNPGMKTLVDELTRYPKVANDDTIDALAYMSQLTKAPSILKILSKLPNNSFKKIRERHAANRHKGKKLSKKLGGYGRKAYAKA